MNQELNVNDVNTQYAIRTQNFSVSIDGTPILTDVNAAFERNKITCVVGPSGSGKSTLIRSLNRINDLVEKHTTSGKIFIGDQDIEEAYPDVSSLRQDVGMVFQKPCVFPRSIRENVLFGVRKKKRLSRSAAEETLRSSLEAATLWDEVAGRLNEPATALSLGQQQRLCMARTLAMAPEVLLLDEPTASIDPISGRAIEQGLLELKSKYTIVIVTHDLRQMLRIADHIIFIDDGELVEQGSKEYMLNQSVHTKTKNYFGEIMDS